MNDAQRTSRFVVVGGSGSAHCCFEATVIDTQRKGPLGNDDYLMCECFDEEDAKTIAAALNLIVDIPI